MFLHWLHVCAFDCMNDLSIDKLFMLNARSEIQKMTSNATEDNS